MLIVLKKCILETKEEYTPLPIIKEKIPDIPNNVLPLSIDDDLFLEVLLMNIRKMTLPYCSRKKHSNQEKKDKIVNDISELKNLIDTFHNEQDIIRLAELNKELEEIRKIEMEGLLIRTHARWIEDGEKATKYFCNLEKRNYINKTVTHIITDNGNEITEQKEILN